jgi:hypothetical protein
VQRTQARGELIEAEDRRTRRGEGHAVADVKPGEHPDRCDGHSRGRDRADQRARGAPLRKPPELGDPLVVEAVVACPEEAREVERAHLLGGAPAHEDVLEVVALTLVRSHLAGEEIEVAGVPGGHDPEREVAHEDEREEERLERRQGGDDSDACDGGAENSKQAAHGLQRPELAVSPSSLKPVVEIRRLEGE